MSPDFLGKLGVKQGHRVALVAAPEDFRTAFLEAAAGMCHVVDDGARKDVVLAWVEREEDVIPLFQRLTPQLQPHGALWVVIPKKKHTGGKPGFATFQQVQAAGLAAGLVDNKDLGFSSTHYGIRFVVPLKVRATWGQG